MADYNLSIAERAILANQFHILAKLSPDEMDYFKAKAKILTRGYEGLYYEILQSFDDPISEELTTEVHEILTMYRLVTPSIDSLSKEEQEELQTKSIRFEGFDANNDIQYTIADFFINEKKLYDELKNVPLNSHTYSSIIKYRKMLPVFERFKNEVTHRDPYKLSREELAELINAVRS